MSTPKLAVVAITLIRPNPVALRGVDKDTAVFAQLRDSIRSKGVINPISVREKTDPEDGSQYYEVLDGLHRYTGSLEAGLAEMPVNIVTMDELQALEAQIVANLAKVDTKPIEYTNALRRMLVMNPTLTLNGLAENLNVSPSFVNQRLSLTKLHEEAQKLVDDGKITLANSFALAKLPQDEQLNFLDAAMTQNVGEFAPAITKRVKEIRDANKTGKDAGGPTFEANPHARKLSEIKAEFTTPSVGPAIVKSEGLSTAAEGFAAGIAWALSMDKASKAEQEAKWNARQQKLADEKAARELERVEKKEKEASEAAAAARAKAATPVAS